MKVAFLTGIFPEENYKEILSNSHGVVQHAADAFQKSIIDGLGASELDVEIINMPFLGSYPQRYSKLFSPSGKFSIRPSYGNGREILGQNIRYCNLTFVKNLFIQRAAYKALKKWAKTNVTEQKIIVVYSLYSSFLKAALNIRKKFSNIKVVFIVPDLLEYTSPGGNSLIRLFFKKKEVQTIQRRYDQIDGFVILSKYMQGSLRIGEKPFCVVEGIYNERDEKSATDLLPDGIDYNNRIVFYAGTLAQRYGIMRLVEAFEKVVDSDARLVICGEGDARPLIEEVQRRDSRIILTGNIPRANVLSIMKKASILVNPRTAEGEFTKYSFPSKTMEYLASGTPTILYKLSGIPDEYFNYCIALDSDKQEVLTEAISTLLSKSEEERRVIGLASREFILSKKNPEKQVSKIVEVLLRVQDN